MSEETEPEFEGLSGWRYIWAHIGVISGVLLGTLALAFIGFLAFIGSREALSFIVVVVVFVTLIALGGRMRAR